VPLSRPYAISGRVPVFLRSEEPRQKLWVNFNDVAGRVLLTLFQQSYKDFNKHFFKVRCNKKDPSLLDEFPLYWVELLKLEFSPKAL